MKLVPLSQGIRVRWLFSLIFIGIIIASLNVSSMLMLKQLWQSNWDITLLLMFLGIALGILAFSLVEAFWAEKLGQHYVKEVRHQLYTVLMSAPEYRAPKRLGVMMTRLITDSSNIKDWASQGAAKLVTHGCSIIGYLCLLATLWGNSGILIAGITLCALLVGLLLSPSLFELARELRRDRGRLSGHLCERIVSYRCVNQFRQIKREGNRLNRASDKLALTSIHETVVQTALTQQTSIWLPVTLACLLLTSVWQDKIQAEDLATLLLILGLLFHSLREVLLSWGYAVTYIVAKRRLEAAMSEAVKISPHRNNRLSHREAHSIKLKNLRLCEHDEAVNMDFSQGEVIHLKDWKQNKRSRLSEVITRQRLPFDGNIVISGRRLDWLSPESLSKSIIHIQERSQLFRGTILTNVRYGRRKATDKEIRRACHLVDIDTEKLSQPVREFGLGLEPEMKDKILVARALLLEPRLLIIDRLSICQNRPLIDTLSSFTNQETFTLFITHSVSDT
ncbi:putative ABC-type multidrug transport system,ATPase and permease component [Vibrio nigripulchritudo SOn1]|uniref:ABC-type multidrug transport system,ATPase and permease component n=1 Tax=Vibrio nigripulchritudo SOn1 TaxID=1238450 RepID=A0AAV2VKW6_9VIBR|nr:ABC transporter ATP-binding protein [Vibrio nigripulchritudo]CCO45300.1 putative ABC-type multidrug transport system,ATPase and permease component [Vibrio nigripulchritudo SOn1]